MDLRLRVPAVPGSAGVVMTQQPLDEIESADGCLVPRIVEGASLNITISGQRRIVRPTDKPDE